MIGVSMMGTAHAADFEPVTVFPFAATAFVGGGGAWLSEEGCEFCGDQEIAHIIGGSDIVLPLQGFWNIQMGGGFHLGHLDPDSRGLKTTQAQGSAIGFWRDPALGAFGIETGFFSARGRTEITADNFNSFKVGGVAEYFFSDLVTIGGFGGALIPLTPNPFENRKAEQIETGFYAGGHGTYYATDTVAVAGFVRWVEQNGKLFHSGAIGSSRRSLNVGGKVRYLTSVPGLEVYASGSYRECDSETTFGDGSTSLTRYTGAQFLGGIKVRLGGHTDSLVAIDRSNAIDTRAWACRNN